MTFQAVYALIVRIVYCFFINKTKKEINFYYQLNLEKKKKEIVVLTIYVLARKISFLF